MKPATRFWPLLIICALTLVIGCGSDDDDDGGPTDPPTPPGQPIDEALEGYWDANENLTGQLLSLNDIFAQIEAGLDGSKAMSDAEITGLVDQYVAACNTAAQRFDQLIALEDAIQPYGAPGKNMFTDAVKGVVKGVYNTGKNAVVSSGQMVRTGWRVLSGSHSLRQALSAPDSGIPIVSNFAQRLQEHNAARDGHIIAAIESGDSQEGYVPLGDLPGATAAEKANYYRNLPDDDPLKKQIRGDVHLWSVEERTQTVTTLKNAAKDGIKTYAGAVSGSDALADVGEQLLSPDQDPQDTGTIQPAIADVDSQGDVNAAKTMIISKRDQPADEPKIVILEGVDPEFEAPVPAGDYDVIVIAEDYIRAAEVGLEMAASTVTDFVLEMYRFAENSVIIEQVTATPTTATVGEAVACEVTAVSTVGNALTFEWSVAGGEATAGSTTGTTFTFTPQAEVDYQVTVIATDATTGISRDATAVVEATAVAVQVTGVELSSEQINDDDWNPGEQVGLTLTVANSGDQAASGTLRLLGNGGVIVNGGGTPVTVPAGGSEDVTFSAALPVNWSQAEARLTSEFETAEVIIAQDIILDVAFYVEIDAISSPVDDRVLTITGTVANPSLTTARMAVGGDINQVFDLNLSNGRFSQQIAVEASASPVTHDVLVVAESGSWHEEDTTTFTSQVAPAGFRVTLTWNTSGTDVDLWVTDPDGAVCKWSNPTTASGLSLDFDDTDGYGPENITCQTPPPGPYLVQVHYYSDHDSEVAIPSSCTVVIRLNEGTPEETVSTYYGDLGDSGDMWTVTTITLGDKGRFAIDDQDAMSWIDPASQPAK